jgi:hypothetical protein
MDGNQYSADRQTVREFITPLNINSLLRKYKVPYDLDLISIDIDGQDFLVWMSLQYRPKVVVIECNANFDYGDSRTIQFDLDHRYDGTMYFGASITALHKLWLSKGYTLVACNTFNCFFVRDDLIQDPESFNLDKIHVRLRRGAALRPELGARACERDGERLCAAQLCAW